MTKSQQEARRKLETAEDEFLRSYGWEPVGQGWSHKKLPDLKAVCKRDAMQLTKSKPELGWPP